MTDVRLSLKSHQVARLVGRDKRELMGSHNGGVVFQLSLWPVTARALVVADLRQVDVSCAGREVYVIVARPADLSGWLRQPGVFLRGVILPVACLAVLHSHGGKRNCR